MEPFIGQLMTVGFNFAPRGWALCDGQLLSIAQNTALFSLLGTTFGGDGRTTFGLPDLRGRTSVGVGTGPGLSPRQWGQRLGAEYNYLTVSQLPAHNHTGTLNISDLDGDSPKSKNNGIAKNTVGSNPYHDNAVFSGSTMAPGSVTVGNTGGGQAVDNMQPSLGLYVCIALTGIFPSRN